MRLVQIECDTPKEYRWLRQHVAGYKSSCATLHADGWIEIHDAKRFTIICKAAGARIIAEKPAYMTEFHIVGASGQRYFVRWSVPSYINPQTYLALVLGVNDK